MAAETTSEKATAAKRFERLAAYIWHLHLSVCLFPQARPGDAKYIALAVPNLKNGGIPGFWRDSNLYDLFMKPKGWEFSPPIGIGVLTGL